MVTIKHKVTIKPKHPESAPLPPDSIKHKVTLKPKHPESAPLLPDSGVTPKKRKWLWGVLVVAALIVGFVAIKNTGSSENATVPDTTVTSAPQTENTASAETASVPTAPTAEGTPQQESTAAAEPATASNVEAAQQQESTAAAQPPVEPAPQQEDVAAPETAVLPTTEDVQTLANRTIRGDYGCGNVRRQQLGTAYDEVQARVNEMYRQGLVR